MLVSAVTWRSLWHRTWFHTLPRMAFPDHILPVPMSGRWRLQKGPEENGTRQRPKNCYEWLPSRGKYHSRCGDFFYDCVLLSALDNPIFQTNFRHAEKNNVWLSGDSHYTQLRSKFAASRIKEVCMFLWLTENSHAYQVCFLVAVVGLVLWKCCL